MIGQGDQSELYTGQLQTQRIGHTQTDARKSGDIGRAYCEHVCGHFRAIGQRQGGDCLLEGKVTAQRNKTEQINVNIARQLQQ